MAAILAAGILLILGFVYWQIEAAVRAPIDTILQANARVTAGLPPDQVEPEVARNLARNVRGLKLLGLFDANGQRVGGNLAAIPAGLPVDGMPHMTTATTIDDGGRERQQARLLAERLPDGRTFLIGRDMEDVIAMRVTVERALIVGLCPAVLICIVGGAFVGLRAQRRLSGLRRAAERIMAGHLMDRLPAAGRGDDLDQLAAIVNRMLDEIARLLDDIKGVGEDIAHDLRTPLTRVRTQLERGREHAATRDELAAAVDKSISGLDQAIATIMALLRITEIEHSRRHSGFALLDIREIILEIAELFEPMAEDKGLNLIVDADDRSIIEGDRELLLEALANLVDNALKFTPPGGNVIIELADMPHGPVVRVVNSGPGITVGEQKIVFRRFYRSDKSRHSEGAGLGLNLVAAVAKLHGFGLRINGGPPGCTVELDCRAPAHGATGLKVARHEVQGEVGH